MTRTGRLLILAGVCLASATLQVDAQRALGPYGWQPPVYDRSGSARLQVTPRNAQVFVDGYFVGLVDDFDGYLQRLHVPAGEHELQLYLDGYRTIRERVLFRPGTTLKIIRTMEPLAAGEANEPRPVPDDSARARHDPRRYPSRQYGSRQPSEYGVLSLRVQPADAVVIVDGEQWDRPEAEERLQIDLAEGKHQIEVRKAGFRTFARTIEIRRGQTMTLNVSLTTLSHSRHAPATLEACNGSSQRWAPENGRAANQDVLRNVNM